MSRILWQESWTLGIDLMDAEHQSLVDGINQLAARFTADPAQAAEPLEVADGDTPLALRSTTSLSLPHSKSLPNRPASISSTKRP